MTEFNLIFLHNCVQYRNLKIKGSFINVGGGVLSQISHNLMWEEGGS